MIFETHITIDTTNEPEYDTKIVLPSFATAYGWKTSNITDDPVLGPGNKLYFTRADDDYLIAYNKMGEMWTILDSMNFKLLRRKIELIMYDFKAN